jgi:uncharacterized protein
MDNKMSSQHPMRSEPTDDAPHSNPGRAGRRVQQFRGPMHRWVVMAALLLAMGAALPARADDAADCGNGKTLLKTDPARVVSACRRRADQGFVGAQYNMGYLNYHGQGVPQNYAEAAKWYRKAAEQGDAHGQSVLGDMYSEGKGVPQSYADAAKWWRKSADQGDIGAQVHLGWMYDYGKGGPQNYAEAAKWYRKAADQGNAYAQIGLGNMYGAGHGVTQDYVQAHTWYNLAAAQGDADGEKLRDTIAALMTADQIAQAQALAAAWKPTTGQ